MKNKKSNTILLGCVTGLIYAFIDTIVAVGVWCYFGQPDYFFRGWEGVYVHLFLWSLIGIMVGTIYGVILLIIERIISGQVHVDFLLVWAIITAALLFGIHNYYTIKYKPPNAFSIKLYFIAMVLWIIGGAVSLKIGEKKRRKDGGTH